MMHDIVFEVLLYFQNIHLGNILWIASLFFSRSIYREGFRSSFYTYKKVIGLMMKHHLNELSSSESLYRECYLRVLFYWDVCSRKFWRKLYELAFLLWKISKDFPYKSWVSFSSLDLTFVQFFHLVSHSTYYGNWNFIPNKWYQSKVRCCSYTEIERLTTKAWMISLNDKK